MTDWETRKTVGDIHEQCVAEELALRGWEVSSWGQGLLGPAAREALRHTDSALRWQPDLIAARGDSVVMVDCKSRMTSSRTGRHAVERAAVKVHRSLIADMDLPLYYVFENLGVLTPEDVLSAGRLGPHTRVGSGAPYYLVDSGMDRLFDEIFGPHEHFSLRAVA